MERSISIPKICLVFWLFLFSAGPAISQDVTIYRVQEKSVAEQVVASGVLESVETAVVHSRVKGFVEGILAPEGSHVSKEDRVIALDNRTELLELQRMEGAVYSVQAAVEIAESEIEIARAEAEEAKLLAQMAKEHVETSTCEHRELISREEKSLQEQQRTRLLYEEKLVSHEEYENAKEANRQAAWKRQESEKNLFSGGIHARIAEYKSQAAHNRFKIRELELKKARIELENRRTQLEQLRLNMEEFYILAPVSGTVVQCHVEIGEMVSEGQPVAKLMNFKRLKLPCSIPAASGSKVAAGQGASVRVPCFPDSKFAGRIARIDLLVERENQTREVEIHLDSDDALRPGMRAQATFSVIGGKKPVIPRVCLQSTSGEEPWVYVVRQGAVSRVFLKLGSEADGFVSVLEGLERDMQIVSSGGGRLLPGDAVRVVGEYKSE